MVAADFVAWLADLDEISSKTIHGYKSAMRHWWDVQLMWPTARSNPFDSNLVAAALRGIKRALGPADRAAAASRSVTLPMGPARLAELKAWLLPVGATSRQVMCWAAACLAAHALLRPNEFLGSYRLDHRAIRLSQLSFRRGASALALPSLPSLAPSSIALSLDATKADQEARNAEIVITHPEAVVAIWGWAVLRERLRPRSDRFFVLDEAPLSISMLLRHLESACILGGQLRSHLTGRCFRRGGTSDLVRLGLSAEAIMTIGRWKSRAMIVVYADPLALSMRASAALRGSMAPL